MHYKLVLIAYPTMLSRDAIQEDVVITSSDPKIVPEGIIPESGTKEMHYQLDELIKRVEERTLELKNFKRTKEL